MKHCNSFEFVVNDELFKTDNPTPTRHEVLSIAAVPEPDKHTLYKLTSCGEEEVGPCDKVNLRGPNTERFVAVFNCQTAGEATLRREVPLIPKVENLLEALGLDVETWSVGAARWAVTTPLSLPPGFTEQSVRLAVPLTDLPETPLDMVWCSPELRLASGRAIPAVTMTAGPDGNRWQRWSRHYKESWDARHHNLATHLRTALDGIRAEAAGR